MPVIKSLGDLEKVQIDVIKKQKQEAGKGMKRILVGMGTCGIAAGAGDTLQAIQEVIETEKIKDVRIVETGCIGLCSNEPIVQVAVGEQALVTYGKVTPDIARQIMQDHVIGGKVVSKFQIEP